MSLGSDHSIDDSTDYSLIISDDSDYSTRSPLQSRRFTPQGQPSSSTLNNVISQSMQTNRNPSAFFVYPNSKSKNSEEYLNINFIQKFNGRIGDERNIEKAKRLMRKMKKLAGMHPDSDPKKTDIPSARMGFALLASLNHHDLKVEALNHLEYLLENDSLTEASSIRLVELAIEIMKQMDRDLIQTEILDVQIKIAKIYGLVAELIQRHYGKKHINAIADELRAQLLQTARSLRDLNRLDDTRLDFYVESALEGIKRILDDHKPLFEIFDRVYNAAMLGVSFYFRDLNNAPEYTRNAFADIDVKLKFSWYDAAITILKLGRESLTDIAKLEALQLFIVRYLNDNSDMLNWRFLYQAIEILTYITIKSADPAIRIHAFRGKKMFEEQFPGLLAYKGCSILGKRLNMRPVLHLEKPQVNNLDTIIRMQVVKSLLRIGNECPDLLIRKTARQEFLNRFQVEKSIKIREFMGVEFRKVQGREVAWINEEPPFDIYPLKTAETETGSLTPREPINFISLYTQTFAPFIPLDQDAARGSIDTQYSASKEPKSRINKVHQQLALALDKPIDWVKTNLPQKSGIRKTTDELLAISPKGMQNLVKLLKSNHDITSCDMQIFEGNCEGLNLLTKSLLATGITQLSLPTGVTKELAQDLAEVLDKRPELEIQLSSIEDIETVAEVFANKHLYDDAEEVLSSGIEQGRGSRISPQKLSNLYLKRGDLHIARNDKAQAEHDLLKALEQDSTNSIALGKLQEMRK